MNRDAPTRNFGSGSNAMRSGSSMTSRVQPGSMCVAPGELEVRAGRRPRVHAIQFTVKVAVGDHTSTVPAVGDSPMNRDAPTRDFGSGSNR